MDLIRALVATALFAPLACAQQPSQTVSRVTVCDLLREPEQYSGKLVEIRAQTSSSEEASVIIDQSCSGSILFLVDTASGSEFRKLTRLLRSYSSVNATLVGVFEHAASRIFGHLAMWDSRFLARSVSDVRTDERGWLVGTAAIFGESGFIADAAKAKVVVACEEKRTVVNADERGDYGVRLDSCKYRLVEAVGLDGKNLKIYSRQARTFIIRKGETTRFDVMISR
jgi:hypothetical protein